MASELHTFVTGPLWMKLKADVADLRVFGTLDLAAAAYFHVRRLLLVRPGWTCRLDAVGTTGQAALTLLMKDEFQSMLQFEFLLKPGTANWFPAETLDERMNQLRRRLADLERRNTGSAYLFGVFDTGESWFYPDETMWEKQSCFWTPVNCRTFPRYAEWRTRWDRAASA